MSSAAKIAAVALLLACFTGCGRKPAKAAPPAEATAPSVPPSRMANQIPPMPPELPAAKDKTVKLDTTPPPEPAPAKTEPKLHHVPHHRPKPVQEPVQQETAKAPAAPPTTGAQPAPPPAEPQVASAQPSEMSPIGQLSTANDTSNTGDRRSLNDAINAVETGINAIRRPLSTEEQKTVAQIRTFITRAREALKADDLDGARTLSTKAHLLLEELTKE